MAIKIDGQKVPASMNEDVLVLPRGESSIVIKARAMSDLDSFHKLCPEPKPPGKQTRDGFVPNTQDDTYQSRFKLHNQQRLGYMVLHTLEPTNIEWELVCVDNPKTWPKWEEEMKASGFTNVECNLILGLVMDVNSLNEIKLKEARDSFLRGQVQEQSASLSQSSEPSDSPSGTPAND